MVRTMKFLPLAALMALLLPIHAGAQNVLEQMQTELARIVKKTRGGVVTIEDARGSMMGAGFDLDKTIASALREATRAMENGAKAADKEPGGTRRTESPKVRAEIAKAMEEMKQHLGALKAQGIEIDPEGIAEVAKLAQEGDPKSLGEMIHKATGMGTRFAFAFGPPKSGSGFFVGDGFVVTTADVLEGMRHPMILADCGARVKAIIVGIDPERNVGLLKLAEPCEMTALTYGDSSALAVGHFAISIGNQSGLNNSVSLAFVAGIRDDGVYSGDRFYPRLIQIAGTVGAGTSGAPLFNARGEVIGMLAGVQAGEWDMERIHAPTPPEQGPATRIRGSGIGGRVLFSNDTPAAPDETLPFLRPPVTSAGFAIPVNDLRRVVEELKRGPLKRGWMGVSLANGVEGSGAQRKRFVRVDSVVPESPAALGGIQQGDIIVSLNERRIQDTSEARDAILDLRAGNEATVVVNRGDRMQTLTLRIVMRPPKQKVKPVRPHGGGNEP